MTCPKIKVLLRHIITHKIDSVELYAYICETGEIQYHAVVKSS